MKYSLALVAAVAAHVSAHGVITEIQGANGVNMPGLSGKYRALIHSSVYILIHTHSPGWYSPRLRIAPLRL